MRAGVVILVVASALLVFAVVQVLDFGTGATDQSREGLREAETPDFCPRVTSDRLPPGFTLRKRETRNLGNGTIGRSYFYGDGRRAIEIHVGYDALDTYEDLDFVERELRFEGRSMTVHVPQAVGSGFLGVTWDDPDPSSASCSELTAIGRRVGERTLLEAAAGVRHAAAA